MSIWVFHHSVPNTYIIWTWRISNCLIGAYLSSVMIYVYKGIFFLCKSILSMFNNFLLWLTNPSCLWTLYISPKLHCGHEFHFPVSFSVPYQLSLKFFFSSLSVLKNVLIKAGVLSVNITLCLWIYDGTIHFTDLSQPQEKYSIHPLFQICESFLVLSSFQ